MSILTGKVGSIYAVDDITAFTTEATTESGSTKIYQIDDATMRNWDPNASITISTGVIDKSYYDNGVNWFEGKVQLLSTGDTGLTVSGSYVTLSKIAEIHGWALNMTIETGETTEVGDSWKTFMSLGKSANVTLSRYRIDNYYDNDDSGYQDCGLTTKTDSTATGLSTTTQYYFKVNVDAAGDTEYNITTAADVTYEAVIALMNTAVGDSANFSLVHGDLRSSSTADGTSSSIALTAGDTSDLFAALTGFTSFETAVAGSLNTKYFLLKLYEDADSGYWAKAIKTSTGLTKGINAIDQESLTFEIDSQIGYF